MYQHTRAHTIFATGYGWYSMVWYGMVEVCEGAPVTMGGGVLTDRHDLALYAANRLFWVTLLTGGMGELGSGRRS